MKSHILPSTLRRCSFAVPLLAIFLFSSAASALLMRDNGPEPVIVQIRESLRLSDDLDNHLSQLETTRNRDALNVVKWCVGNKLLVMLSFPSNYTERQALAVIGRLQSLPAVEKVVAVSASNLEFAPADFTREYTSNQAIPEAARRGLDRDELSRSPLTPAQIDEAAQMPHVPRQLIVRWKSRYVWRATAEGFLRDIANFHAAGGARVIKETRRSTTDLKQVIEFDDLVTPLDDKLRRYAECPWVDYVQPNFIYNETVVVNDPYYTNPGQPNLAQVKAPQAWSSLGGNTTGNQNLVVAVGDSGLNLAHPDFSPNVLPSGHHNFVNNSSDVSDFELYNYVCGCFESSHGNNVTGILGAKGNNLNVPPGNPGYMVGVTHHVSLLILKVTGGGSGNSEDIANAIVYAATADQTRPAAIAINLSLGNQPSSQLDKTLEAAVDTARGLGMVVVAAAGNHSENSDLANKLVSPASIPTDNLIAVGAVRSTGDPDGPDSKPNFSNYGRYRVELGAPGGADGDTIFNPSPYGILGLRQNLNHNPPWSRKSGTSMAAPHVTGAIQLVKSKYPWENYAGLRDRVIMATDDVTALDPNGPTPFRTGGRLNLEKALKKRTVIRNASVRAKVENNDRIVIGGIIVGPSGPCGGVNQPPCLTVAIRGLGPTLPPLGVPRLNNPKLRLNNYAGFQLTSNDDWGNLTQDQRNQLAAAGLTPGDPREAAIVYTMSPGTYTVFMESQDGQQGVGLFEVYELSGGANEQVRLKNLSVRCPVGIGDEVAIAGTNLTSSLGSAAPKRRLLMRAKGPSLSAFGLQGVLADPLIELRNSLGDLIESNDQWRGFDDTPTYTSTGLEDKLIKSALGPTHDNESALWPTLVQGTYTATLKGVNNGTGIGLIDFLEY